jgi:uncharacterized phage protein (TIGR02218 family)
MLIELHEWHLAGTSVYWRYTASESNETYDGNTFRSQPGLRRSDFEQADEPLKDELEVTLPIDCPFTSQFILSPPDGVVEYTLYRGHDSDFTMYWQGRLKRIVPISSSHEAVVSMGPPTDDFENSVSYMRFQRNCCTTLFSTICGVDPDASGANYEITGTVVSINGSVIEATQFAALDMFWLVAGWLKIGNTTRRIISQDTGTSTVTVIGTFPSATVGASFVARVGCDLTFDMCVSKFNNGLNFRGQPWIPSNEPFTQRTIA